MGISYSRLSGLAALFAAGLMMSAPAQALQCVPYARVASGIDIKGDAWKWWYAAAGTYERGHLPRVGAVLVFRKHAKMRLGHVAVVRQMLDSRTMLIDHANWGPLGAGRGTVSKMVPLRDVSAHNDWSAVQVWNQLTRDFGTRTYPTYGFIYPKGNHQPPRDLYVADLPEEVAADLDANAPDQGAGVATPAVAMIDMADAVVPVFVPAVSAETIDPAPHGTNQSALDDRAAAQRAGAGHYGTRVIDR